MSGKVMVVFSVCVSSLFAFYIHNKPEKSAAVANECGVIELPSPIETCDMVSEPYLHCRNGSLFDPSASGDERLNDLCVKVVYREPRKDAAGNTITWASLHNQNPPEGE